MLLMMSCSTTPPQPCTASLTSVRAPSEVMTIGTLYLAQTCMSCSSRSLRLVHDLVDREGRRLALGVVAVPGRQRLGDLGQPLVELLGRARVERRHRADDAGLALRDHELGVADDEQRRADDRQRQVLQDGRASGIRRPPGPWR